MRFWWLAVVVVLISPSEIYCRNVTNEDIRDAMLSLVHMFRNSEDKLERHEFREKSLGDQLKKLIIGIDKRQRVLEPVKGMVSRLDERLSNVETLLLQKEKTETANQEKINKALDEIKNSLQDLTATVMKIKPHPTVNVEDNLTTSEDPLNRRLDATDVKLDTVKAEIESLKNSLSKENLHAMCLDVASEINPFEKHLTEAEKLLNKYELKLNEYGNSSKIPTDFIPLSEVTLADEAWHSKMTEVMERQEKEVHKIQQLLSDAESMWKELPRARDVRESTNRTLEAIGKVKSTVLENGEKVMEQQKKDIQKIQQTLLDSEKKLKELPRATVDDESNNRTLEAIEKAKTIVLENGENIISKLTAKLREMSDRLQATNEDIQKSLTQGNNMNERVYSDISRGYDILRDEVNTLVKNEHIIVQIADNVLANKKRIEYGVHQILSEVGDLIKVQGKKLNLSVIERLDGIEQTLTQNQAGALTNLTSKIETEMSQVWRQISVMYQQLISNKMSLDKLTAQTDTYVHNSTTAMGDMNGKVGLITEQMTKVNDDLNYLLGRLSLITLEFNKIKTGLGEALDHMKDSLHTIRDKVNGPVLKVPIAN